jgi:hypothetical protein
MRLIDSRHLCTIDQVAASVPAFRNNHRTVRHLINKGRENGLFASGAVVRLGSRLYVDLRKFNQWLSTRLEGE